MRRDPKMPPKSEVDEAVALLDVLRSGPVGVSSAEDAKATRAALLPHLEEQVAQLPRLRGRAQEKRARTRRWVGVGSGLAVAAGVTLAMLGRRTNPPEPPPPHQAEQRELLTDEADLSSGVTVMSGSLVGGGETFLTGQHVRSGHGLLTRESGATLRGGEGYHLQLAAQSEIEFPKETAENLGDTVLHLRRGVATFQVLPLPTGSTFSVVTRDTRITVVGTAFSVEVKPSGSTCVKVTEGKVRVQGDGGEHFLTRGQSSGCEVSVDPGEKKESSGKGAVAAAKTTLAQQNELLSQGLAAERQGNARDARRAYVALLDRYPGSAFAQDARAGLSRLGPGAAQAE